jgi:hypothetical protein
VSPASATVSATPPLASRRQRISWIVVGIGLAFVGFGFVFDTGGANSSPAQRLRHAFLDDWLAGAGLRYTMIDLATRAGVIVVASAGVASLACAVLPSGRRFLGLAAGAGLLGVAVLAGEAVGAHWRGCPWVTIGPAAAVLAVGFAAIFGGGVAAVRSLTGSALGVALTGIGVALGGGVAYLVAANDCPILL